MAFPHAWRDQTASEFARKHEAGLAVGRRSMSASSYCALRDRGCGPLSPEAEAARNCYGMTTDLATAVTNSSSGRELTNGGYPEDVVIATEINSCASLLFLPAARLAVD